MKNTPIEKPTINFADYANNLAEVGDEFLFGNTVYKVYGIEKD